MAALLTGKSAALSMVGDALLAQGQPQAAISYQQQAVGIREQYAASLEGQKAPYISRQRMAVVRTMLRDHGPDGEGK